jgi:hypothetical protein
MFRGARATSALGSPVSTFSSADQLPCGSMRTRNVRPSLSSFAVVEAEIVATRLNVSRS